MMRFESTRSWLNVKSRPLIIAGPCSAESEAQIMQTTETLAEGGVVSMIRAGVWKPRTRPNSFEGMGKPALSWIARAQTEFRIPFTVEVANEDHVKAALDAGIQCLWIGARTTVNPFSVQEIADALAGTQCPILVKNPLNPDLQLWIGALERLQAAGLNRLVAVHRGFNTYQDHVFRNSPNWEIPIELKTRFPDLEVVVDPSHISGRTALLHDVAQKALDLGFDGLMIETHPMPSQALSDAEQQIALSEFHSFLNQLEKKNLHFEDALVNDQLSQLRKLIDEIDHNLIENLARRLEIVQRIGEHKAEHNVTVFQLERWQHILKDRARYAELCEMNPSLITAIWSEIHKESLKLQTEIVNRSVTTFKD